MRQKNESAENMTHTHTLVLPVANSTTCIDGGMLALQGVCLHVYVFAEGPDSLLGASELI